MPPPATFTLMSKWPSSFVSSSGWRTIIRAVLRPKNSSIGLLLIVMAPVPRRRNTRAVDDLRRPVAEYCWADDDAVDWGMGFWPAWIGF